MAEKKTELVSFRATPTFKQALKVAAEREKRSQANLLEKLVLDYCELHCLTLRPHKPKAKRAKRSATATVPTARAGRTGR